MTYTSHITSKSYDVLKYWLFLLIISVIQVQRTVRCVCVCVCVLNDHWPRYLGQVQRWRSRVKVHSCRRENATEVVSVTSSVSFLVKLPHGKPPAKWQHVILVAKRSQVKIHPVHYKVLTYWCSGTLSLLPSTGHEMNSKGWRPIADDCVPVDSLLVSSGNKWQHSALW